jgi:WD40 repeat protein
MWDARSGDLLRVIRATRDPVDCAVFSSDAKLIAAAIGGTVRIWRNLDLDEWRTLARQRVFRDLTDEERAQYGLPSQPSART